MSRDAILQSIRKHLPESAPLPDLDGPWIQYPDPTAQFRAVLEMIGGRCVRVADVAGIRDDLGSLPAHMTAERVLSVVSGVPSKGAAMDDVADPHELENVDFAILPGEFGVAENAAVWVTTTGLKHRVAYFLCHHLALVVPTDEIVNNLGEAYRRIRFDGPGFGTFIAGPSKTADIEQSLVIGAHGPKSLTVYLIG